MKRTRFIFATIFAILFGLFLTMPPPVAISGGQTQIVATPAGHLTDMTITDAVIIANATFTDKNIAAAHPVDAIAITANTTTYALYRDAVIVAKDVAIGHTLLATWRFAPVISPSYAYDVVTRPATFAARTL